MVCRNEYDSFSATSAENRPGWADQSVCEHRNVSLRRTFYGACAVLAGPTVIAFALMARNPREAQTTVDLPRTTAPIPSPTFAQQEAMPLPFDNAPDGEGVLTGELQMPRGITHAMVDGSRRKLATKTLTLACGAHTVKLPRRAPVRVVVPCGGMTAL